MWNRLMVKLTENVFHHKERILHRYRYREDKNAGMRGSGLKITYILYYVDRHLIYFS